MKRRANAKATSPAANMPNVLGSGTGEMEPERSRTCTADVSEKVLLAPRKSVSEAPSAVNVPVRYRGEVVPSPVFKAPLTSVPSL